MQAALDIIIPFHGRCDLLVRCASALALNMPVSGTVMLIDDASPRPPSVEIKAIIDRLPLPVRWMRLRERMGFVGAVNCGWAARTSEAVLIINNDVVPADNLIEQVSDVLQSNRDLGAVSPCSNNPADLFQYRAEARRTARHETASRTTHAPYLTAACLAIRQQSVDSPWLLDPIFSPGYFDDLDLSCRIRAAGWKLGIIESCRVHHSGQATFRHDPHRARYIDRNYLTFTERWGHLSQHRELERLVFREHRHD